MSNKISEDTLYLINVIADIRTVTGVNEKPMLSELADAIDKAIKAKIDLAYLEGYFDGGTAKEIRELFFSDNVSKYKDMKAEQKKNIKK